MCAWVTHQGDDDFTVGAGLEVVLVLQGLTDQTMVVDLSVDGEDDALIVVGKGLGAGLDADNAETLMAQDCGNWSIGWLRTAAIAIDLLVLLAITLPPALGVIGQFLLRFVDDYRVVTQNSLQSGPR